MEISESLDWEEISWENIWRKGLMTCNQRNSKTWVKKPYAAKCQKKQGHLIYSIQIVDSRRKESLCGSRKVNLFVRFGSWCVIIKSRSWGSCNRIPHLHLNPRRTRKTTLIKKITPDDRKQRKQTHVADLATTKDPIFQYIYIYKWKRWITWE